MIKRGQFRGRSIWYKYPEEKIVFSFSDMISSEYHLRISCAFFVLDMLFYWVIRSYFSLFLSLSLKKFNKLCFLCASWKKKTTPPSHLISARHKSLNHKAVYKGKKKRLILIEMTKHHSPDCALVLQTTFTSSVIRGFFSCCTMCTHRFQLLYFTLPSVIHIVEPLMCSYLMSSMKLISLA